MRRWIAAVLITVLTVTSSAPAVRAQSAPLIGGGLTALPTTSTGPNLVQNPGFETAGPAGWPAGGWSQDQVTKHSGTFSFRRDSGGTSQQLFQLKAGTYKASAWIKTSNLGSGSTSGARLTLDFRPGGINAWTPSDVISGTNDWKLIEIGPIVVETDRTAGLQLEMYNGPSGTAWFDDVTLTQIMPSSVEVFLLYPNFRGMLFDDGPSTMKFDVKVTPPGNDFARFGVTGTLKDEATGQVVASQTYATAASFVADLEGGAMQPGRAYLATFALVDKAAGNAVVSTYPAYRVSRASAAARSAMKVSFDTKNRVLINGVPRFVLGVYDSGSGYSAQDSFWENQLWSPSGERRMDGMNINMYLNYWYGEAPADAMKALMANLQKRGVTYLQTGNCFDKFPADGNFMINSSDAYVQDIGSHPGSAGYYTIDECIASMVPGAFTQYDRLRRLDPDSITFSANFGNADLALWRDSADIISTDPYPMFGSEPSGGYNHKQVADWTAASRNVVKDARPIMTVLQFFKFTSQGRWPSLQEMRNHAYMAIVEGARGLWWWSLGDNALLAVCSGWCAEKTGYMNNLKSVVNEIAALEPALLADDSPGSLTSSSNGAIKTKVKLAGGKGYVFAYNSTNTSQSATFGWNTAPGTVTVNGESRTLGASGNSFSDTFGPYQAHVYVIGSGGTGGTPSTPTPTNPTVAFTAPAANATVSGTTTVTLAGSGGSGSGYTYALKVDGAAVTGTGASFSWDTTKVVNGSHTLTATVTDSASGTGTATLIVNVSNSTSTPPAPTPVTVSFTSPTNGATVTGTVAVNLAALGGSGTTYTYGLKADGVAVAGTGPTFSWDTTKLANGSHTLTATATDPVGGSGSASITVNVSNATSTTPPPPTGTLKVYVTQPSGGATVSGTSWAVMWLDGSSGTSNSYTLTLGGKPMGTTTTASKGPVSMPYDTKLVVDGSQPLMATVKDATGNTGGSTVNVNVKNGITSAPVPTPTLTASFTSPGSGATVSGTTTVGMSVAGSTATSRTFQLAVDGTVVSTQTVSGTTASYALNTATLSNAAHALSLTVTDSAGGSASASLTVTVSNVVATPLSASFSAPAAGATVSGSTTVGMTSAGGSTSSASRTYQLAVDGATVSTQTVSGTSASYAWNTASVGNGSHTLTLTVTDTAGGSASSSRTVTVSNVTASPPPATGTLKVYITQPTASATVGGTAWAVIWIAGQSGTSNSYTLSANGQVVASQVTSSAGPVSLPWVTSGTPNGTATLTATVKDATGNTGATSINVTVRN